MVGIPSFIPVVRPAVEMYDGYARSKTQVLYKKI